MSSEIMKVLITGGAGFLGSHLAEKCIDEGFTVNVVDNLSNGSLNNLQKILGRKSFSFIKGDVKDKKLFYKLPKDFDVIFHLAANMKSNKEVFEDNVDGTKNILEVMRKNDIEAKFIYTSSTRAMGFINFNGPLNESLPCNPDTLYGKSKYLAEKIIEEFGEKYGFKTIIFRLPRIYGPRDWQKTFYHLMKLIKFGVAPRIDLKLNLIYVKNLVHGLMLACREKRSKGTYIITDGKAFEINEIVKTIEEILKKKAKIRIKLPKYTFKFYSLLTNSFRYALKDVTYSIEKVKKELGYRPIYNLKKGIFETMKWCKIL